MSATWEAGPLDALLARGVNFEGADTRSLLQSLVDVTAAGMRGYIARSESPEGAAFAPLKRPRRDGGDPRPMMTGHPDGLYSTIHGVVIDQWSAAAGHGKYYGEFLNAGTSIMPARRFVGVDAGLVEEFGALIGPWATLTFAEFTR